MSDKKPNNGLHAWRAGEHIIDYVHGGTGFTPFAHSFSMHTATDDNERSKQVAALHLHPDGTVDGIEVHPRFQRQGLATKLWNFATEMSGKYEDIPTPKHSNNRTPMGDAWARSMGAPPVRGELVNQRQFKNMYWD